MISNMLPKNIVYQDKLKGDLAKKKRDRIHKRFTHLHLIARILRLILKWEPSTIDSKYNTENFSG